MSIVAALIASAYAQKPASAPTPEQFRMEIEDVFSIAGVGTVVKGKVELGKVKVGDDVDIVGINPTRTTSVTMIIKPPIRERQTEAVKGDDVNIVLRGVQVADIKRGQILAAAASLRAHSVFKAKIDLHSVLAGGRKTPIFTQYRPQIKIGSAIFTGVLTFPASVEMIEPGTKGVEVEITLAQPAVIEEGLTISLREGSRTVGTGVITSITPQK